MVWSCLDQEEVVICLDVCILDSIVARLVLVQLDKRLVKGSLVHRCRKCCLDDWEDMKNDFHQMKFYPFGQNDNRRDVIPV